MLHISRWAVWARSGGLHLRFKPATANHKPACLARDGDEPTTKTAVFPIQPIVIDRILRLLPSVAGKSELSPLGTNVLSHNSILHKNCESDRRRYDVTR
jgi:hypothetical protein